MPKAIVGTSEVQVERGFLESPVREVEDAPRSINGALNGVRSGSRKFTGRDRSAASGSLLNDCNPSPQNLHHCRGVWGVSAVVS